MDILIIGGTRNLGHLLTLALLDTGHRVTLFNRGQTPDELPADIQRLRGDRSDPPRFAQALAGRSFDVVVDTTLYNGADARQLVSHYEHDSLPTPESYQRRSEEIRLARGA